MLAGKPVPLGQALAQTALAIDAYVKAALAEFDLPVAKAMSYAIEGGKALRGFLVLETARLHGIGGGAAIPAAAAIECLHAYSLIHDDLPCMDDDDLRRGRPTVHRRWDEATAVLAGDALQSLAFELVLEAECSAEARLDLVRGLAKAAGVAGMVGGQAMDIAAETATLPLSLADVEALQSGKTGALITWSALAGARMARSDLRPLKIYGDALGRAFQIADDILDVEGDAASVGKAVGKDAVAGKATFISHLGLDGAKRLAKDLVTEACDALADYGSDAETLRDVARFVIARDR